jgi:hypothetical protein
MVQWHVLIPFLTSKLTALKEKQFQAFRIPQACTKSEKLAALLKVHTKVAQLNLVLFCRH